MTAPSLSEVIQQLQWLQCTVNQLLLSPRPSPLTQHRLGSNLGHRLNPNRALWGTRPCLPLLAEAPRPGATWYCHSGPAGPSSYVLKQHWLRAPRSKQDLAALKLVWLPRGLHGSPHGLGLWMLGAGKANGVFPILRILVFTRKHFF